MGLFGALFNTLNTKFEYIAFSTITKSQKAKVWYAKFGFSRNILLESRNEKEENIFKYLLELLTTQEHFKWCRKQKQILRLENFYSSLFTWHQQNIKYDKFNSDEVILSNETANLSETNAKKTFWNYYYYCDWRYIITRT